MSKRTEAKPVVDTDLYQQCPFCEGAGELRPGFRACLDPPSARRDLVRLVNGNFRCFACDGDKFVKVGLTLAQVDKLIRDRDSFQCRLRGVGLL